VTFCPLYDPNLRAQRRHSMLPDTMSYPRSKFLPSYADDTLTTVQASREECGVAGAEPFHVKRCSQWHALRILEGIGKGEDAIASSP
jgi:hypothetical protein